jgi:hypothetical protein
MSKLARREELLSSKRFIVCLFGMTILFAIVHVSESKLGIPYGQDTEALVKEQKLLEFISLFCWVIPDFELGRISDIFWSITDFYLGPMIYHILLGSYMSLIATILLCPIFVRMGPAIFSRLFTTFTCVLSHSICHLDGDSGYYIYNGRPRLFRVIFSGITSFPIFNAFTYRYYRLFWLTRKVLLIFLFKIWTMIPLPGRTPEDLAASPSCSGVLRLLRAKEDTCKLRSRIALVFEYCFIQFSFVFCLYILYWLPDHMGVP